MSGTTYQYHITGATFEGGGTLDGYVTVTYTDATTATVDAVDIETTTGGGVTGYQYTYNPADHSSDTVLFSQFVDWPPHSYQINIVGTNTNYTLVLSWSGYQPTTLDNDNPAHSLEQYDGNPSHYRVISGQAGSSTGLIELACFAAGTRLLTDRGEVAVDALRVGDRLPTLFAQRLAPVKWIGTRTFDAACHPRPWDVAPVRVHADAFGSGQPARDLLLSPDHAVLVDHVLIPIRYLLNGATIAQESAGPVTYFHVELDSHDAVFAEGLPSETYLDTGNRAAFENAEGATMMTPDFARATWAANGCAPLVTTGPLLVAIRQRLLDRAEAMGHTRTRDAAMQVLAEGAAIAGSVDGRHYRFDLPAGTRQVRILSRHAVPAEEMAESSDARRLGIAIAGLTLDGAPAPAAARTQGWQAAEPNLQWTNGDATLDVAGARTLAFAVVLTAAYWVADIEPPARLAA